MSRTNISVAGVGNDGSMLVRVDDVRDAIQTIHDDYATKIAELESALHQSELKIISLESELSTSKAWYKVAEGEMVTLNKQVKGGAK